MDVSVALGSQKLADGRTMPSISVPEVKLHLPSEHVDVKIHGNIVVAFANAFKVFFKEKMTGEITKTIKQALQGTLPGDLNHAIKNKSGTTELFEGTMLDWTAPKEPIFSEEKLFVPLKGLFFKKGEKEAEPSIPVSGMVPDPAAKSPLKFAVSAYSIESILRVHKGHSGWTTQKDLPADSSLELNTASLDYYLPGIEAKYGNGLPRLYYELLEIKDFKMVEKTKAVSFKGSVRTKLFVNH